MTHKHTHTYTTRVRRLRRVCAQGLLNHFPLPTLVRGAEGLLNHLPLPTPFVRGGQRLLNHFPLPSLVRGA
jgi:hypothetical protein